MCDKVGELKGITRRAFASGILGTAAVAQNQKPRPNVVILLTDDQGYGDLSCHGNPHLKTPNLDRLHAESVRLTNFHVDPICAPTRAALMTGRYACRAGVWATVMGRSLLLNMGDHGVKGAGFDKDASKGQALEQESTNGNLKGFSDVKRTYGWVKCFPAIINNNSAIPAHLLLLERTHYDKSMVEMISPEYLKGVHGLANGDGIKILVRVRT